MKKIYNKPTITVMHIQHQGFICTSVFSVNSTGAEINFGGSSSNDNIGNGAARSSSFGSFAWDDISDLE